MEKIELQICAYLLVHDSQQREEVPLVSSARAGRHVGGHHQCCQRRRMQTDEGALVRLAICTDNTHGSITASGDFLIEAGRMQDFQGSKHFLKADF